MLDLTVQPGLPFAGLHVLQSRRAVITSLQIEPFRHQ